jgi:hypothetical protein
MNNLLSCDGLFFSLLERVKQDHTLMLSIRKNYVNIYYRGGNILKLEGKNDGTYHAVFNAKYNPKNLPIPSLPCRIENQQDANQWVNSFQVLKGIMDIYFSTYNKPEREFQQLIARENNFSTVSNQSEYFISDIEFADSSLGARFDMLGFQWLASQRKNSDSCRPAIIEMKYGDGALDGSSSIIKHLEDIVKVVGDHKKYQDLLGIMELQFNQLDKLGLINFNRVKNWTPIKLNRKVKPEVIFILANHNPRSSKLKSILDSPEIDAYDSSKDFDLKFYVSCFAGYALHSECMLSLQQFRQLLAMNRGLNDHKKR